MTKPNHQARDADGEGFGLKSSALARKHVLTRHERELLAQAREIKARVAKERKAARPAKVRPTAEGQRNPRLRDNGRLKYVRRCPCLACEIEGGPQTTPTRAAHVRSGYPEAGWPHTGKAEKPSDFRTLPLCDDCHTDGPNAQHRTGERGWWEALGIHPPAAAEAIGFAYAADADPVATIHAIADEALGKLRRSA